VWATGDYLYARQCGGDAERQVLSFGEKLERVWAYRTQGTVATDTIGEFLHVVGDGAHLYAFGGATHSEPVEPPAIVEVRPWPEPAAGDEIPIVPLSVGVPITSWAVSRSADAANPQFEPLPAEGIWSHERFTAGLSAIDLTAIRDRSVPVKLLLATILQVPEKTTVGWELLTPGGEIWNRDEHVTAIMHVAGKQVAQRDYLAFSPGRYLVTLELKRGAWPEPGKIWIGPRFVEAPEKSKLVADRSRYMVDKKHWEEHSPSTRQTFVMGQQKH
jgi:hypothetical protein